MPVLDLNDYTKTEKKALEVRLGEKTYKIPLAQDLPVKDFKALRKAIGSNDEVVMIDFLAQFLGQETVDSLPMSAMTAIFKAWGDASNGKEGDLTPGES